MSLCKGPRDFPRFFGGSDPLLVTLGNCSRSNPRNSKVYSRNTKFHFRNAELGRTTKGAYSPRGRSRHLLETPFSEPLLRTLLRTLSYCKSHSTPPSQNPSENPSPEPYTNTTILGATPGAIPGIGGNPHERFSYIRPLEHLSYALYASVWYACYSHLLWLACISHELFNPSH